MIRPRHRLAALTATVAAAASLAACGGPAANPGGTRGRRVPPTTRPQSVPEGAAAS